MTVHAQRARIAEARIGAREAEQSEYYTDDARTRLWRTGKDFD